MLYKNDSVSILKVMKIPEDGQDQAISKVKICLHNDKTFNYHLKKYKNICIQNDLLIGLFLHTHMHNKR